MWNEDTKEIVFLLDNQQTTGQPAMPNILWSHLSVPVSHSML